jgi:hypothetical protein
MSETTDAQFNLLFILALSIFSEYTLIQSPTYLLTYFLRRKNSLSNLTLIGMREGTFHPLSFLDQILSAKFLSKISKLFWM